MREEKISAKQVLADALLVHVEEIPNGANIWNVASWTSLGHLRLISSLEDSLGHEIKTEDILKIIDLESIQEIINNLDAS
jgi:acyl carrier protein